MKKFYRTIGGKTEIGAGAEVPSGWIEYNTKSIPDEVKMLKLESLKQKKKLELEKEKEKENLVIETPYGTFAGGRESAKKIDETYRLGLMAGDSSWQVVDVDNNILTVDESAIKEIILRIAQKTRDSFLKFVNLQKEIENATSKAEIEAIKWS